MNFKKTEELIVNFRNNEAKTTHVPDNEQHRELSISTRLETIVFILVQLFSLTEEK